MLIFIEANQLINVKSQQKSVADNRLCPPCWDKGVHVLSYSCGAVILKANGIFAEAGVSGI